MFNEHTIAWVLESSISTLGQKWGYERFSFYVLCCTASIQFHIFTLSASVQFQNVFCCRSHLNCNCSPNFKSCFLKLGVHGQSTLQYWDGWDDDMYCKDNVMDFINTLLGNSSVNMLLGNKYVHNNRRTVEDAMFSLWSVSYQILNMYWKRVGE